MKISDIIDAMPAKTYRSFASYRAAVRRHVLRTTGVNPIATERDADGHCVICGESGRCCGLHMFSEVAEHVTKTAQPL